MKNGSKVLIYLPTKEVVKGCLALLNGCRFLIAHFQAVMEVGTKYSRDGLQVNIFIAIGVAVSTVTDQVPGAVSLAGVAT